jgi:hypothetical protein
MPVRDDCLVVGCCYRGLGLHSALDTEFTKHRIDGKLISVVSGEMETIPERGDAATHSVDLLDWDQMNEKQVPVTGGLTSNIGAATHFAVPLGGSDIPVVLVLDAEEMDHDIIEIDYSLDWFDEHEGVLAWVETLAESELRVNGQLYGLTSDGGAINRWGRSDVEHRATSNTYVRERESVATTESIDFKNTHIGTVSIYPIEPGATGSPRTILAKTARERVDRLGIRTIRDVDRKFDSQPEIVEFLHGIAEDKMAHIDAPYWSVVTESDGGKLRMTKDTETISPEHFKFACNSDDGIVNNYDAVPAWALGDRP